ncbi:hypothetical protein B0A49_09115 [Cryomyces minteri]|uniref:Uncharacterized protein n=1 Tax=Cryomyces minteri TaxID=331657 RepID=A0A4U0WIQ8_9PEZI|nr:hypothetical protein B0A49_09115 [Cryomyces minteri]
MSDDTLSSPLMKGETSYLEFSDLAFLEEAMKSPFDGLEIIESGVSTVPSTTDQVNESAFDNSTIDPRLTFSTPPSPTKSDTSNVTHSSYPEPDFFALFNGTQSGPTSPAPYYGHPTGFLSPPCYQPNISRAQSQPPEAAGHTTFSRAGSYIGNSIDAGPRHSPRPPMRGAPKNSNTQCRYQPYPNPHQRLHQQPRFQPRRTFAPTSVPAEPHRIFRRSPGPMPRHPETQLIRHDLVEQDATPGAEPDEQARWKYAARAEQSTVVMGMLSYIERLTRDCDSMREFLCRGYGEVGCGREAAALEATRLQKRNKNSAVTELAKKLSPLSLPASTTVERESSPCVPKNGQEIKDLDQQATNVLLDLYDIPFVPTMFLYEKKALYLRFIGASRALMHRVLD